MTIRELIDAIWLPNAQFSCSHRLQFMNENGDVDMEVRVDSRFFDNPDIVNREIRQIWAVNEDVIRVNLKGRREE